MSLQFKILSFTVEIIEIIMHTKEKIELEFFFLNFLYIL